MSHGVPRRWRDTGGVERRVCLSRTSSVVEGRKGPVGADDTQINAASSAATPERDARRGEALGDAEAGAGSGVHPVRPAYQGSSAC